MSLQSPRIPAYGPKDPIFGTAQPPIVANRNPATTDRAEIGTLWINKIAETAYLLVAIVAGSSIWVQITPAAGTGFTWNVVAVDTVMLPNNGYVVTGGGGINLTLPAAIPAGAVVGVAAVQTDWAIQQGAGQQIFAGNVITVAGAGHGIHTTDANPNNNDAILLVCSMANAQFTAYDMVGNLDRF